jgi:hypothetical protein
MRPSKFEIRLRPFWAQSPFQYYPQPRFVAD